jgi:hypothetical protein
MTVLYHMPNTPFCPSPPRESLFARFLPSTLLILPLYMHKGIRRGTSENLGDIGDADITLCLNQYIAKLEGGRYDSIYFILTHGLLWYILCMVTTNLCCWCIINIGTRLGWQVELRILKARCRNGFTARRQCGTLLLLLLLLLQTTKLIC